MLYRIFFIAISIISTSQLQAQRPSVEFQIFSGAGMPISFSQGVSKTGFSGDVGVGTTIFVSRNLGVHFGIGIGTSNTEIHVDNLQTVIYGLTDANRYLFDLHSTISDYTETLRTEYFFNVPLMLQFQPNTHGFYAKGGAKVFFSPFIGLNPTRSFVKLNNVGFYPQFNNWATEQTFAGFGTFNGNRNHTTSATTYEFNLHTVLAFEVGWKWRIGESRYLYTGAFINHSLGDPLHGNRQSLDDNLYGIFTNNNLLLLSSELESFINTPPLLNYADRIGQTTIGVKLRLGLTRRTVPRMRRGDPVFSHPTRNPAS